MSGETASNESGWSVDTLRIHLEQEIESVRALLQERYVTQVKALDAAFDAQRTAMEAARASAEKAVDKAETASEKRFDAVNEFRAQLADQARTFMPRAESYARHDATAERMAGIEATMVARLGAIDVGLSRLATHEMMQALERNMTTMASRREVGAAVGALEEKLREIVKTTDKRDESLLARINANALAIEKASAQGQTVYVLRGEAAASAAVFDEKVAAATHLAASNHTLVTDSVNELRASLAEQSARFMPRSESETRTMGNTERLREIEIRMQSYPSRDETAVALSAADAKFAAGVGAITEKTDAVAERLAALDLRLSSRLDLATGKSSGYGAVYGWAVAAIGLIISVVVAANSLLS